MSSAGSSSFTILRQKFSTIYVCKWVVHDDVYLNVNESVEDNEVLLGGDKMHMNIRLRFCYVRRHTCGHVEFNASLFTSNKLGVIYHQSIVLLTFRLVAGMKLVNTELYYIALLSSLFSFTVAMHFRFLYHLYMQ